MACALTTAASSFPLSGSETGPSPCRSALGLGQHLVCLITETPAGEEVIQRSSGQLHAWLAARHPFHQDGPLAAPRTT